MKLHYTMILLGVMASTAGAQSVGDPALLAKQQRNAEIAADIIRQEPLYQENVLAGARLRKEREAAAARESADRALRSANAAVARAEANLHAAERTADRNIRALNTEMMVRQTMALESMARRRR